MRKKLNIFGILFAVWGAFILSFWLSTWNYTKAFAENKDGYVRLIELLVVGGIFLECLVFKKWGGRWNCRKKIMVIFFIALSVRIFSLPFSQYIPSSDFAIYFDGATYFTSYGFEAGLYPPMYTMYPMYAWQAIINGLFLSILSPTMLGMQILNSLFTAGICVLIYLIGRSVNSRGALVGAILYTFYPMSILSTHITTNHHGAAFFLMVGVYLFEIAIAHSGRFWKRLLLILASALCFVISNFYHASVILVLCSLIVTMLVNEVICLFSSRKTYMSSLLESIKQFRGRFLLTIMVIIIYEVMVTSSVNILIKSGYTRDDGVSWSLGKIIVGLNQETNGSYSAEDAEFTLSHTSEELLVVIKDRLSNPKDVIKLMVKKTKDTWFYVDNYSFFYAWPMDQQLNEKIEKTSDVVAKEEYMEQVSIFNQIINNIGNVDALYINGIWLLAIVGIGVLILRYQDKVRIYTFLFIPMGWMAFITFTEMQSRYRYQGMPAVILLAAWGIVGIYDKLKLYLGKIFEEKGM